MPSKLSYQQRIEQAIERDRRWREQRAAERAANGGYNWADGSMEIERCSKCRKRIPGWPQMVGRWTNGYRALCAECKPPPLDRVGTT